MKKITVGLGILAGLLISPNLHASMLFIADLTGAQDGVSTTATGLGTVLLNNAQNQITVDLIWFGLTGGPAAAAHIHCCAPPGTNAGVLFPLVIPPVTTGMIIPQTFAVDATQVAELEAGLMYINIHDAEFPAGEIRGQLLSSVAEPVSFGFLGVALAVVAGFRLAGRRRRAIS